MKDIEKIKAALLNPSAPKKPRINYDKVLIVHDSTHEKIDFFNDALKQLKTSLSIDLFAISFANKLINRTSPALTTQIQKKNPPIVIATESTSIKSNKPIIGHFTKNWHSSSSSQAENWFSSNRGQIEQMKEENRHRHALQTKVHGKKLTEIIHKPHASISHLKKKSAYNPLKAMIEMLQKGSGGHHR